MLESKKVIESSIIDSIKLASIESKSPDSKTQKFQSSQKEQSKWKF